MSRKKRQGDPESSEGGSTDDENQNVTECPHIKKSVDLQNIRKALIKTGFQSECDECKRNPNTADLEMGGDFEFDTSLWMCLRCGNQACGRGKNQHALQHFHTPHSDSHSMCVNTTIWNVWCYECDDEVNITCKKKLLETVEYLRKRAEQNQAKPEQEGEPTIEDKVIDVVTVKAGGESSFERVNVMNQPLPGVRGLSNLGNTCFFNSVMQCLGQTPYLVHLLEETSRAGENFRLPGGKLILDDKNSIELEPLEGVLEEWRPLTRILAETLRELQSGRKEVYVPRLLLSRLTQRMPQFAGGDQHDSHELLRHLLEAVREEDLRRYQTVILDKLGLSKKTDPASVEGDKKKIIRFYGQQASELLLPTEQVFRGILLSTLQCQECEHTSHREEFFLDLSLPISEKQMPPVLRRKAEEIEDNKPSQYQIKKEKRAAKKNKKQKSQRSTTNNLNILAMATEPSRENNSGSESDADVEDNADYNTFLQKKTQSSEDNSKGNESGYNSDKADNGSPVPANAVFYGSEDEDIDPSAYCTATLNPCPLPNESPENSLASTETNVDMGSPMCGRNSPIFECNEEFDRPESRLSFVKNKAADLKTDFSKLSLLNDENNKKMEVVDNRLDGAYGGCEDEKMEESYESDNLWGGTMSARYLCKEGECSVQSCLNQFTACELMTGNNKVSCKLCTKRHGGSEKKTVYTNAMKQLLIYNPPAVLILHLKRFQVHRFRSMKVVKQVTFQTLLDLAPFCSKKSQSLPTFNTGDARVLYSLYGVVEHSGSIHGGHYVAYVKVRPQLSENDYRWQFLPKNQSKGEPPKGAQAEPESLPGKWYYVSDSFVSEVAEQKVLKAQAYLLFYERIL